MKTFDNEEMKQFKDLSPDEMHCIVRAKFEGKLQYCFGDNWHNPVMSNR